MRLLYSFNVQLVVFASFPVYPLIFYKFYAIDHLALIFGFFGRTRSGATPSLATRATLAAWSPNVDDVAQNGSVTAQDSTTSLTSRGTSTLK